MKKTPKTDKILNFGISRQIWGINCHDNYENVH